MSSSSSLPARLSELSAASSAASSDALRAEAAVLAQGVACLDRAARSAVDGRQALRSARDAVAALAGEVRGARLVAAQALAPPAAGAGSLAAQATAQADDDAAGAAAEEER